VAHTCIGDILVHEIRFIDTFQIWLLLLLLYSDSLRAERSGDRIPEGAKFSAPVQTGSEAHPVSYTKDIGSFPGVKRPGRDVDHPPPSRTEGKERVELYLYSFYLYILLVLLF